MTYKRKGGFPSKLDKYKDKIEYWYTKQFMGGVEIAEELKKLGVDITPRSVQRYLHKAGIEVRSVSDALGTYWENHEHPNIGFYKWGGIDKAERLKRSVSQYRRKLVKERDNYTCQICGKKQDETLLMVDHIKPLAQGGDNSLENLQTLCWECNLKKAKYYDVRKLHHKIQHKEVVVNVDSQKYTAQNTAQATYKQEKDYLFNL